VVRSTKKLRVLVADDSQFMRVAYKRILETQEFLEVVGMASDGEEALQMGQSLQPDVAILDVRMPRISGIEVAQRLVAARPNTGIVIVSAYDDTEYILELLKDGPQGKAYLLKTSVDDIDELIRAVQAVANGQTVLDPHIVERLARIYSMQSDSPVSQLTGQERDVLSLMAEGYSDSAIAEAMSLDNKRVEALATSIYSKLKLDQSSKYDRRVQAVLAFVNQNTATPHR
jgi:DNA-binding NarL/FixJ family response regulator